MKLISGSILMLAAEQAYGHAQLVPFTNRDSAVQVFVPASLILLSVGVILLIWGLFTEVQTCKVDRP